MYNDSVVLLHFSTTHDPRHLFPYWEGPESLQHMQSWLLPLITFLCMPTFTHGSTGSSSTIIITEFKKKPKTNASDGMSSPWHAPWWSSPSTQNERSVNHSHSEGSWVDYTTSTINLVPNPQTTMATKLFYFGRSLEEFRLEEELSIAIQVSRV